MSLGGSFFRVVARGFGGSWSVWDLLCAFRGLWGVWGSRGDGFQESVVGFEALWGLEAPEFCGDPLPCPPRLQPRSGGTQCRRCPTTTPRPPTSGALGGRNGSWRMAVRWPRDPQTWGEPPRPQGDSQNLGGDN